MKKALLLLVDDKPDNLFVLEQMIAEYLPDCETVTARDGQEGLAIAAGGDLDGAIIDMQMPGMDGIELCKRMKTTEATAHIPIVLITVHDSSTQLRVRGLEAGADDFISKPIDNIELVAKIKVMLRIKKSEGRLKDTNLHLEELVAQRTQELRESEHYFRSLLHNMHEDIIVVDREYGITDLNNTAMVTSGHRREEIVGRRCYEIMHGQNKPCNESGEECMLQTVFETGEPANCQHEHIRIDGSTVYVDILLSPLRDEEGNVTHVIEAIRDITERRLLEDQLRQAQKMEAVGQLAGGIAHDFNNLLTAIIGHAQLALQGTAENSSVHDDLREVESAGERAAELTQQLLAFSRKQVIRPQVMDLNREIRRMTKLLQRLIREDIDLQMTLAPDLWRIMADPSQVEQVLINLVINARDAMPAGGRIILETNDAELGEDYALEHLGVKPGRYVMLAVIDNGCGMSEEVRKRIFDPFFTTKPEGEGTGLGLSTIYGIVKQHGGNIWVYSEEGRGTTFKVYLPATETRAELEPAVTKDESMPHGSETILVVEDEETVRKVAVKVLIQLGYTVVEALNGRKALELVEKQKTAPNLLITDVVMPDMGGEELAEEYRRRSPGAKVLFMSGYTDSAIQQDKMLKPGMELLEKPFTPPDLARKVREVLDKPAPV